VTDQSGQSISESPSQCFDFQFYTISHSDDHVIKSVSNSIWETQSSLPYTFISELFSQSVVRPLQILFQANRLAEFAPMLLPCYSIDTSDVYSPIRGKTFVGSRREMLFAQLLSEWTWLQVRI